MAATYGGHEGEPVGVDPAAAAGAPRGARGRASSPRRSCRSSASAWSAIAGTQPAYSLSYANRRRLEIARALATRPRLLLLDEPAAGMNPNETHEMTELIGRLRDELGLAILVIEHDMHVVEGMLRPRRRARPRRQDRRGQLRRRSPTHPGGRRGVPGARPRGAGGGDERGSKLRCCSLDEVTTYYGQMRILEGISLQVGAGELVCLLGGNASGKSTTLKTILGIVRPRAGRVAARRRGRHPLDGPEADRARARDRAREPAPVRRHDRAREPRARRGAAPRREPRRGLRARPHAVPAAATSAATSSPGRCRAASSRWWRWAGR